MLPGASSTILEVSNDYANLAGYTGRAVSLERVKQVARLKRDLANSHLDKIQFNGNKGFGLAISGAHYEDKESHAWVYLSTNEGEWWFHKWFAAGQKRMHVASMLADEVHSFVQQALFNSTTWIDFASKKSGIDVMYGPGISDVERLMLLSPGNPLAVRNGVFCRTVDVVRDHAHVYPGAFNPPTASHLDIGQEFECLFEITRSHVYKNAISVEDLLHRVRMLNSVGQSVLITDLPMYFEKYNYLTRQTGEVNFVMGTDAWNHMIARHQYPSDEFLTEKMPNASFTVFERDGHEMNDNQIGRSLEVTKHRNSHKWSSTHVREAEDSHEHDALPEAIKQYVKNHNLYSVI